MRIFPSFNFAAKRLLNNNPRAASRDQILALLEANFEA